MSDDLYNPADFFHRVTLTVRFGDVDMLGHVNHTKYLTYMEHGRIRYAKDVLRWDGNFSTLGMILAKATVEYKLPLRFAEIIHVLTRCSRLGNKSFDMLYLVCRDGNGQPGEIVATGITNMVAYDYGTDQTIPVPDLWREQIVAFEKKVEK